MKSVLAVLMTQVLRRVRPDSDVRRSLLSNALLSLAFVASGLLNGRLHLLHAAEPLTPIADSQRVGDLDFSRDIQPLLSKYCSDCHGEDAASGDFTLDRYADRASVLQDRATWTKALKLLRLGAMPPPDSDQPQDVERTRLVDWLDHQLHYVDCNGPPSPGRVTLKRLNRTEYNNTVRDLFGIDFQPADDFPSDDVGYGFDNIGDVLSTSPLLLEKYLDAAEQVANAAVPLRDEQFFERTFAPGQLQAEGHVEDTAEGDRSILSVGRIYASVRFPRSGLYQLRIRAMQDQGGDEDALLELRAGEDVIATESVAEHRVPRDIEVMTYIPRGRKDVSIHFLNDFYDKQQSTRNDRNLIVKSLTIRGPFGFDEEQQTRFPLLAYSPGREVTSAEASLNLWQAWLPRIFRRSVTGEEVFRFAELTAAAGPDLETWPAGVRLGLQAALVSPHFLYRLEQGRRTENGVESLDDEALASRLSYFLWSTTPDAELRNLAAQGKLHEPEILREQVRRLLRDPRSSALARNFAGQWLGLRKLTTTDVAPDPQLFPEFTPELRQDLWRETELFFAAIVREDRSIYDLLDGRFTYVNRRLARYYGIPDVTGDEFVRVDLQEFPRAGVLTQGSILTITSFPNRTSPVKRGQWVLENLLGDSPPDPPPNVPGIEEAQAVNPDLSFREQLLLHRADPGCASCHVTMDEIGFGLENFDAIGRWRETVNGRPVDSSGALPSGEEFSNPLELLQILRERKSQFASCLTERLLTYAIGRGVEWTDRCTLDQISAKIKDDECFSSLVLAIVESAPFQMRSATAPVAEEE